jgi:YfiH family protein
MSLLVDDDTGLVLIKPDWPDCPKNVRAYSSTRIGGVSLAPYGDVSGDAGLNLANHVGDFADAVKMNRACLAEFVPSPVIFLSQIHGNMTVNAADLQLDGMTPADACYANLAQQVCAVLTADCLPVLLAADDGQCVAAVHAGWRGLANGVIENAVAQMRASGAQHISAWLGPAIGSQFFEVGTDVLEAFCQKQDNHRSCFRPSSVDGKFFADIYGLARNVLLNLDIVRVSGGDHCTFTEEELFYSYRRDGVTGRMASWIWFE